MNKFRIFF